jgi:hypothetical protein
MSLHIHHRNSFLTSTLSDARAAHYNQEKLRREEDIYCKQLSIKLKEKLDKYSHPLSPSHTNTHSLYI